MYKKALQGAFFVSTLSIFTTILLNISTVIPDLIWDPNNL